MGLYRVSGLHCSKGVISGIIWGSPIGVVEGDTGCLDHSSHEIKSLYRTGTSH